MGGWRRLIILAGLAALVAACGDGRREAESADRAQDAGAKTRHWRAAYLTPRAELLGDPRRIRGRLSPDGATLTWMEPVDGAMTLWSAPLDDLDKAAPITATPPANLVTYEWLLDNSHILYIAGRGGVEPLRAYSLDVVTGESVALFSGGDDVHSGIVGASWDFPDEVIVAANEREPSVFDLYRVNVATGERRLIFQNDVGFTSFLLDHQLNLALAVSETGDGGKTWSTPDGAGGWRVLADISADDALTSRALTFDGTNRGLYAFDSRGRDAAALVRLDVDTGETRLLAALDGADTSGALFHPTTYEVDAVLMDRLEHDWAPLTTRAASAYRVFDAAIGPGAEVLSRTVDDRLWVVYQDSPVHPGAYYLYDRANDEVEPLFDVRPNLADRRLAPMTPVVVKARDGLDLVSYLTLPPGADGDGDGRPERSSPLVIIPQADPFKRTTLRYNSLHQWLADRGYATLTVNVRGATGFGKAFANAGDGEIGGRVQDDLEDAADWAIAKNVTEPGRIATFGFWLGGHASLMAATRPEGRFACASSYDAPTDLVALIEDAPPHWTPYMSFLRRRIGDPSDPAVRTRIAARSPLNIADRFAIPVFLAHGALDGASQTGFAEETARRIEAAGGTATFMSLADDAGSLENTPERLAFYAALEAFFADCLGGRLEPIETDLVGDDIAFPVGVDNVPAIAAALSARDR